MSTPLELAVEIAGTLKRFRGAGIPLDVMSVATDISSRHPNLGYSRRDIADTLTEEGLSAGLPLTLGPPAACSGR